MDGNSPDISELRSQIDVRKISKAHDPQGRDQTAGLVRDARTLEQIRKDREQISEVRSEIATKLDDRKEKTLVKLKLAIGLGDKAVGMMQSQISELEQDDADLLSKSFEARRELEKAVEDRSKLPNPKDILNAYYEKVAVTPLTNEEKRELLTPEVLAQLTKQEYIALWRRLNPHFLAHVTRQGIRDHTGDDVMVQHNSGYGKFVNGFVDVMQNSRRLFPPLARTGLVDRNEATVKSFLSGFLTESSNPEEAKDMFLEFLNRHPTSDAPKYPDITATHLAAQIVSDSYYGGETRNEVFFVYPSDILASQYSFAFNGRKKDFTRSQSETKWNDVFIWTDPDHPGVPVDMGIVFLPETVPVDPQTGSRYASEIKVVDGQEKRVVIENTSLIKSFVEWGKKIDDQSPLKQAFTAFKNEEDYYRQLDLRDDCYAIFIRELQGLGVVTNASAIASKLISEMWGKALFDEETLQGIVEGSGAHLILAESTIPAKQYWESYFAKNPTLRPKHVQYYDGDPTAAIFEFQQQNNIGRADTSKTEGQLLGFDDHHVVDMKTDPRARVGYDELVAMAEKIIEDHYKT